MIDGNSTVNFGTTTFIDYAVSWTYLSTYTLLTKAQFDAGLWSVGFASNHASTDHANLTEVSGNVSMNSTAGTGMTTISAIPEPTTASVVIFTGLAVLIRMRRINGI